ncbi:DUF4405 domain-containing protein [Rhizobium ruizarguesonis]|uniref:DUF4405 domain-containing protein n=1 Tax=Rhizobium ruizarguesonis TaxID=2081791 RepID=UPI0013C2338A|nr:DUF4405 domain-containing protein [Rhizobium ruizarguesonis]NEI96554.1 DUF4405 domain-containing protein [Rhizobium ruizarguesonis]NEJ33823.1 DUF4405 domain-containing protein [Rhizobium ruizarguesonis]
MATLLLLSLAYWWLDNRPHEVFGTALFVMLAWHVVVNRLWFTNLLRGRYDTRRTVTALLHLLLIGNMLVLLITSVIISKSLFASLPIPDSIYLRDIHWFSAYWVMIIVGVHLGLHWTRVMAVVRSCLGMTSHSRVAIWALRLAAVAVAGFGVLSMRILGVWAKLTFTYSLDFWDFTASVTPFFGYWAGVVALPAVITHYGMCWWRGGVKGRSGGHVERKSLGRALEDATGA